MPIPPGLLERTLERYVSDITNRHGHLGPAGIDLIKLLLPAEQVGALDDACISSRIETILVIIATILALLALALLGLSPEPHCGVNRSISSRYQSRIATVIHITAYDLRNCSRS